MSTYSNVDIKKTFRYIIFLMELYQSGANYFLIQIFKWILESWEFLETKKSLFPAVLTTIATFSPN